jgi:fatty acid desaturase
MTQTRARPSRAAIPARLNLALAATVALLNFLALLAAPLWLISVDRRWGWMLFLVPLTTPLLWALIHESIHGNLHPARAVNDAIGRALAVLFGAPFGVLRFGHLAHHRYNRTRFDRTEVYEVAETCRCRFAVGYFARLLGGLYAAEASASLLALLPKRPLGYVLARVFAGPGGRFPGIAAAARRTLAQGTGLSRLRCEGLAAIGLWAAVAAAFGDDAWMPALALLGRAVTVSLHDNAYHYGQPLNRESGSRNLSLPSFFSPLILNFNLHAAHHRHPELPWTALPGALARAPTMSLAVGIMHQLQGPIAAETLAPDS